MINQCFSPFGFCLPVNKRQQMRCPNKNRKCFQLPGTESKREVQFGSDNLLFQNQDSKGNHSSSVTVNIPHSYLFFPHSFWDQLGPHSRCLNMRWVDLCILFFCLQRIMRMSIFNILQINTGKCHWLIGEFPTLLANGLGLHKKKSRLAKSL